MVTQEMYAGGMTWLYCFQATRPSDGKRVENSKRVGLVANFPDDEAAWAEVRNKHNYVTLRQEIATQAVANLVGVDTVVLLSRCGDGPRDSNPRPVR